MTDTAIRVENLGKRYQLGGQKSGSFRESLSRLFSRNGASGSQSLAPGHPASGRSESQPASKPAVERIQHLANQQDFWALRDINFEIKRGEAVGIIGRNGAGKSTLLKILSRITEPTTGRFEVFGRVSSLLEVGTGFHPELTGRENVYLNGTILGMKRREVRAKFDEIVAFSGVEKFIDTPVKHYSSGMQVRLAFAVAAHLEPEILIIDEVLAVGDAEFQKKCLGKMEDVTGEGRTVLFVSHNMGAVENLCSKSIWMSKGTIEEIGETNGIINCYLKEKILTANNKALAKKKGRTGNGSLRFESIQFYNEQNEEINSLKSGDDIYIKLKLLVNGSENLNNLIISMGIDNNRGTRVALLSNELTNQFNFFVLDTKEIQVSIRVNKLPLKEGNYIFTLFAKHNEEVIDWLPDAGAINVVGGDFFQTGKSLPQGQGDIFVEHSFVCL